jgi:hypothetical protein
MKNKGMKLVLAIFLTTILICIAIFGTYLENERKGIIEMETINASNSLYYYTEALEIYGNNLQILTFEKENQVYAYKLNESLGMLKRGSDGLSRETYGAVLPEKLNQNFRELSRQLSNFTYRFMDVYPYQSPEMDVLVLEMAKQIHQVAGILDTSLETSKTEPWVKNPANNDEWMIDKGYRIDAASAEMVGNQVEGLIEENEKLMQCMDWE